MRNLSDDELLTQLAEARFHSPVIDELCKRLEAKRSSVDRYEPECPVCRATLDATVDPETGCLTLRMKK